LVASSTDFYIAKYNSSGTLQWVNKYGGAGIDVGNDIALFNNNYLYVTGYFNQTFTLGDDILTNSGGDDVFIAAFDINGNVMTVQKAGGMLEDRGNSIAIDVDGNIFISGYFKSPSLTSNGSTLNNADANPDLFVSKYKWATGISKTNVACFGNNTGSATVTPANTIGVNTYSWSTTPIQTTATASNLVAGTYSVTVTDALTNTVVDYVTITEPAAALTNSYTQVNVSCNGGNDASIDLTPAGGTIPYTYLWDDASASTTQDLNSLSAGTYNVTITDANLCTSTNNVVITEPTVLSSSFTQTNILCNGNSNGAIDLTPTGGTIPYTYNWDSGHTIQDPSGIPAATYNVTVTDNKLCTTTNTVVITQPAAALSTSFTQTNISCNGLSDGAIDLIPTGGTIPYTYQWDDVASSTTEDLSGLAPATYNVTVTDANLCTTTNSVVITEPTILTASAIKTDLAVCGVNTGAIDITVTGGTDPKSYEWSSGQLVEDINTLTVGTYTITITDANLCTTTNTTLIVCSQQWLGLSDDWADGANWNSGNAPISTANVTISSTANNPVIDGNMECNNLTIETGASITIEPNASVTANGNVIIDGDLTINSNASGTGAFVNLGSLTVAGTTTVNRYIGGGDEYHLVSAPISNADLNLFSAASNILGYNENFGTDDWTDGWDNSVSGAMTIGKGYAVKYETPETISYIGNLNTGNININVINTNGPEIASHEGWNLVGNPYPSPIDWDAASGWTKTNVNDEIHFWNGLQYASYNAGSGTNGGTNYIPLGQGFMVKCNNVGGAGTLVMNNIVRVINTQNFWKETESQNLIKLNISSNGYTDESIIRFNNSAEDFYENYDAYKMFTNVSLVPQIYTYSSDSFNLSINTMNYSEEKSINLCYKVENSGTYTFNVIDLNLPSFFVYLEDKVIGQMIDLNQNESYSFTSNAGNYETRFVLHFNAEENIINNLALSEIINIFSFEKTIYINSKNTINGICEVYDLIGQIISKKDLNSNLNCININGTSSMYLVKVRTNEDVMTKTIFIK
jgi:hypothetical protein